MKCVTLELAILVAAWVAGGMCADLAAFGKKQCGSAKTCNADEYCTFQNQCSPCSEICTQGLHNFQASDCQAQCQEYLHDLRYVRNDASPLSGKDENLRAVVQRLQYMVTVTLTLTCITLLAVIVIVTVQICKWRRNDITIASLFRKVCSKKSNDKSPGNGVTTVQASGKPDLRLDMPPPGSQSENSPATLTTSISRRPAEDSALDYAYDNHALSSSPSPHAKPHESNF